MESLDFSVLLHDRRLLPLTQMMSLTLLDNGDISPSTHNPLILLRMYKAAFCSSCDGVHEGDSAYLCKSLLRNMLYIAAASSFSYSNGTGLVSCDIEREVQIPSFVTQSIDMSGRLAERRLFLQLQHQICILQDILTQTSLSS
ncbi:uncharacterized protein TM35_000025000 [Trypanosoma theileri]|uniref:Uncharacterized protein n=1 Tax=Trypanosoma theileri TaxID=67003 RepID=A0A1X0P8B8_9TRYP|nr:uncharacterized protein TM35_000025000 [Trypanosoma theileri]ORC93174.1 hypothetical protein TM35_000025000 [Trypanosoma theileri]